MPTILISTVNYNGQIADIIFSPDTGGTVNLGSYVLPQQLELDYVYGNYDLSFSAYGNTCSFYLSDPSNPTPTPTTTVTPTITPTVTPTLTVTPTTTITPSPTITPSNTNTPTQTPTTSITPSITPSISETPTASGIRTVFVRFNTL